MREESRKIDLVRGDDQDLRVIKVNVHKAETQFPKLLERAHAGEEIVLVKNGQPYARLVPVGAPKARQPALLKAKVEASFFERQPEDELEALER